MPLSNDPEDTVGVDGKTAEEPPSLSSELSQDERYLQLLKSALDRCRNYRPRFGQGRKGGVSLEEFAVLYGSDPFYHWIGLDSPLMYAAHKAAGGMTSVYRQVGIGIEWIFRQMLQDCLSLSSEQATWSYAIEQEGRKPRTLSLDGRLSPSDVADEAARTRVTAWIQDVGADAGVPSETLGLMKGVVFETRQGYKSKDSKRQNADIINASTAYAHLYVPVIILFSTQIDNDIALRYKRGHWGMLIGTLDGPARTSTYSFCRDVVGYDLADFFIRHSDRLRAQTEEILQSLLTP